MRHARSTQFRSGPFALMIFLGLATAVSADEKLTGQIHEYPRDGAASSLAPHNLSFEFPKDGIARPEFKSEEFYAIILISAAKCSLLRTERFQIQKMFPQNKVFMDLYGCDDEIEENISYTNTNSHYSFIAVFGGTNFEQASQLFKQYDLADKFPGANIRKMQAVLVYS